MIDGYHDQTFHAEREENIKQVVYPHSMLTVLDIQQNYVTRSTCRAASNARVPRGDILRRVRHARTCSHRTDCTNYADIPHYFGFAFAFTIY